MGKEQILSGGGGRTQSPGDQISGFIQVSGISWEVRSGLSGFSHKREVGLLPFIKTLSVSFHLCSALLGDQKQQKGQALRPVRVYFLAMNGTLCPKPSPGCSLPAFSVPIITLPPGPRRAGEGSPVTVVSFTERNTQVCLSPQT